MNFIILVAAVAVVLSPCVSANEKLGEHLRSVFPTLGPENHVLVWVFFSDKGRYEPTNANNPGLVVSERSLLRRQKVRQEQGLVDSTDLPVDQAYIDELASLGVHVRHRSKWFNCVSAWANRPQIHHIEGLSFVSKIELVWRVRREEEPAETTSDAPALQLPEHLGNTPLDLDYGPSLAQVQLINVPAVHNTGNYGQGVIVGVFDNGFRLLQHEAFDSLRTRIVATYDFVDHKVSVVPNNPDPGFGSHGIITLSTLGGFKPGNLIGPAFGASFVLARTENDSSETPIEEDNWVAAIEWADSIGVDVTSTSLGYLDYDPPYASWTWQDMNGNTTLITRAADMAVRKGIVVVNSAGNNGFNSSHNTLNAPADGDSVITVGAVTTGGTRAGFSSVGPTTSVPPRIKPDVVATGTTIRCASPTNPSGYTYQQGTSLSCPLAAGVAALILHVRPNATPVQIANALRSTASRADAPDNLMGWGIINAVAATGEQPVSFQLKNSFPNPFPTPSNPSTTIRVNLIEPSRVIISIYNILGQEVRTLLNEEHASGQIDVSWDGRNNNSRNVASGVYFSRLSGTSNSGNSFAETRKLTLLR